VYFLLIPLAFFVWSLAIRDNSSFKKYSASLPVVLTVMLFALIYIFPVGTRVVPKWTALDNFKLDDAVFRPGVRYIGLYPQTDYLNQESASTIMPSNTPMYGGVKFVNGYSPMMLKNEHLLFGFQYSSSIIIRDLAQLFKNPLRIDKILDLLGIQGLVLGKALLSKASAFEDMGWHLDACSESALVMSKESKVLSSVESVLTAVSRDSEADVANYLHTENPANLKHAVIRTNNIGHMTPNDFSPVAIAQINEGRNSITAAIKNDSTTENGMLVFRRAWYPGYRAFLDGEELPVLVADLLLPAVEIPKGRQGKLTLVYEPASLRIGLVVVVFSLLLASIIGIYGSKSHRTGK
jgi:hypothetical protein